MANPFTIWRDTPVIIKHKIWCKKRKAIKPLKHRFILDNGDVPVVTLNEITKVFEPVINLRGNAYAARNRLMYRKKKRSN